MKIKLFKLRHIPTGLYFQPSRGNGNLSVSGKIYKFRKYVIPDQIRIQIYSLKKEPYNHFKKICDHFNLDWNNGYIDKNVKTNKEDWEVLEFIDGEFCRVQPQGSDTKDGQDAQTI
jgi:hypothetical protein